MTTSGLIFEVKPSQINNLFYFIGQAAVLAAILFFATDIQGYVKAFFYWINDLAGGEFGHRINLLTNLTLGVLVAMPGLSICWRYLETHLRVYTFRADRLVFQYGVLNRNKDNVEYYRIKDFYSDAPFWMRPFGISNFHLISTDRRSPYLKVPGIKGVELHEDAIRNAIEKACQTGRGQEIDIV